MAKQKLEAELGLNTKEYNNGIDMAIDKIKAFASSAGMLAGTVIVATKVAMDLVDAFKQTSIAIDTTNVISHLYKQTLSDIVNLQQSHASQAIENAVMENRLRQKEYEDLLEISKLNERIAIDRLDSADRTKSDEDRMISLKRALEGMHDLMNQRLGDKKEELNLAMKEWEADVQNEAKKKKAMQIVSDMHNLKAEAYMSERRMTIELTNLQDEQNKKQQEAIDKIKELGQALQKAFQEDAAKAIKEAAEALEKLKKANDVGYAEGWGHVGLSDIYNQSPKGVGNGMPGLQPYGGTLENTTKALSSQQEAVLALSDTFSSFFSNVDKGFKGMIDGVIKGIERMVQEMIARAAIMALISAITGVPLSGNMLKSILPSGLGTLLETGGSNLGGTDSINGLSNGVNVNVTGEISGKNIALALRRNQ
jgi:hypothetical protein